MKVYTILIIALAAVLLAGCPSNTTNTNTANNANTTNSNANGKNTNTAPNASPSPSAEKTVSNVNLAGNWESEFFNKKGENYTQMTLNIKQTGETVTGTYSVNDFVGGEWQGEDGNQTPFTGTIKDGAADIKFDPNATVAGYEENVKYKEPTTGKPSTATLTMEGGKLKWKLTGGESPTESLKEITLTKVK